MVKTAVLILGPHNRHWASPPAERSWQRFWGTYGRHRGSGLYIARGSDPAHVKSLVKAFQTVPEKLQEVCLDWAVTFTFAGEFTTSGNMSTFYADFSQSGKQHVSPHIEMGQTSLQARYIRAHLTHELSHLFWRSREESQRDQFRQFLRETCPRGTIEVTEYVQELFDRGRQTERWFEEAFCETMAALVDPRYPALNRERTVDLRARRRAIETIFGLNFATKNCHSPRQRR